MSKFSLEKVQKALQQEKIEAWLFYDFQGNDPISHRILDMPSGVHLTRRWFYLVPRNGNPKKLVHRIEPHALRHLPGETKKFAGWRELKTNLASLLSDVSEVAMQYSPRNAIPYVSRLDAGTRELVEEAGPKVITAADLIQQMEAVLSATQLETHIRASKALREIVNMAFTFAGTEVSKGKKLTEYDVQEFIWQEFAKRELISDSRPIVGVGPNSGDPHYEPTQKVTKEINEGDFLLIDLWAKEKAEGAIYADITWTGYLGKNVPEEYEKIFQVVRGGRDAALELVREAVAKGRGLQGWEVDEAARRYITEKGYGDYFVHRTGHSIDIDVHGIGANMDNFETREVRKVLPHTCFSIEPGVYLKEFGVRSEIDVYVGDGEVHVYSEPIQTEVKPIPV